MAMTERRTLSTMLCSSIGVEMFASSSIHASGIPYEARMPRVLGWRAMREGLRRSRGRPREPAMTECFGALTVKDKMVVKGLAASLVCPAEQGLDRW